MALPFSSYLTLARALQYGVVVNQFNGLDPFSDKNSAWTKDNDPKYPISE